MKPKKASASRVWWNRGRGGNNDRKDDFKTGAEMCCPPTEQNIVGAGGTLAGTLLLTLAPATGEHAGSIT